MAKKKKHRTLTRGARIQQIIFTIIAVVIIASFILTTVASPF